MKTKLLRFWLTALMLLVTTASYAYDACIDGIFYYFSGSNATVTRSSNNLEAYSGDVVIPSTVDYKGSTYKVTSIDDYAFYYCLTLSSITIPESVTSIGDCAFCRCSSLTSITILESVTSIGKDAFNGCSSLTAVNISDLVAWCNINFNDCYSTPLYYAHRLYVNGKEIEELVIPESVAEIKPYAFYSCSSLTSITIPESVTSIGDHAFIGCM